MKCPKGFIKRDAYTTKKGVKYVAKCIRSVAHKKTKRADEDKKILEKRNRLTKRAYKMAGGPKKCSSGKRLRKAYYRKNTKKYYPSRCIKTDLSPIQLKSIESRKPILLRKGTLGTYGYKSNLPKRERQQSIKKAIESLGPLTVMRKINILMIFSKKGSDLRTIYESDKNFIYKNYDVKAKFN